MTVKSGGAKARKAHWKRTQEHWDDDVFLAQTANAFMKRRWRRLNRRVAGFCAAESARLGRRLDLVDVGCAHADFEAWARPHLASYSGIEPSKALLPRSIRRGAAFQLLRGQAEKLPLADACADLLLLKEVLDHCYDPAKVLAEARRVLRPGGVVLLTLTNDQAWYKRLLPAWAQRIKASQDDHLYFFDPAWVARLLRDGGFDRPGAADSHYLRLPHRAEALLGRLPEAATTLIIHASDAVGGWLAPGRGGSFWAWARRPDPSGRAPG